MTKNLLSAALGVLCVIALGAGTNEILNSVFDSANSAIKVINYDGSAVGGESFSDSAGLRGVLSDESGTGAAIFAGGNIGAATATTPSADDNTTSVATTAYVQAEIAGRAVLTGRAVSNLHATLPSYFAITGLSTPNTSEPAVTQMLPAITPASMQCFVGVAPGSGKQWAFALRRNTADTDWSCVIADTSQICSDSSGSALSLSATFAWGATPTGTPASAMGFCYLTY